MGVQTELTRISGAKTDLKAAIQGKGVAVAESARIDAYPALVQAITQGVVDVATADELSAKYAISRFTGDVFDPCDLMDYGLDEEQCCEICRELNERGELNLPDGVAYGGDVE